MNAQTEITHQQELELLAEWLGIEIAYVSEWNGGFSIMVASDPATGPREWNPSPTGNSDDFLNMVAGRVDIWWDEYEYRVYAQKRGGGAPVLNEHISAHNNDKVAAMKHAAYQVCLMAAKEWKEAAR